MTKSTKYNFTFIDLFSGIGGFRIALESLGGKCEGFSEINKIAIKVYKDNFSVTDEVEIGDITKAIDLPSVDILTGGVPCQSWSIAGKKKGFDDPRGKLWLDTIITTSRVNPKAFIYENVKGLSDPRNRENLNLIRNEFNKIGYKTYVSVLNAFDFCLPQSRERLFLVGIRNDIDKGNFTFPDKSKTLPLLADIIKSDTKSLNNSAVNNNHRFYKNSFNIAAIANKGNFYIFSDVRNGEHTIHSWDLMETTQKEKNICLLILKNRRKPTYGSQDGNPMSYEDIKLLTNSSLFDLKKDNQSIQRAELENLVSLKILRKVDEKYEFINSKISSGINGIYRIFLPESHVFSTLTKTGSRDFIALESIPVDVEDRKEYFIQNILMKKKFRGLYLKEATLIQGFPENFKFNTIDRNAMALLGNAVAVNVVEEVGRNLLSNIFE